MRSIVARTTRVSDIETCVSTLEAHCRRQVAGGWSCFLRKYLELHLFGPGGLATGGAAVTVAGRPVLLHACLWSVLADGEGHMKAWDWVGASGMKPCIEHFNVLKKDSEF